MATRRYVAPSFIAPIFLDLGDKDQALDWWAKACENRDDLALYLKVSPWSDGLRGDPRFTDLLRKTGLPP